MTSIRNTALALLVIGLAIGAVMLYGHLQRNAGAAQERALLKPDSAQHQIDSLRVAVAQARATATAAVAGQTLVRQRASAQLARDSAHTDSLERRLAADTGTTVPRDSAFAVIVGLHRSLADLQLKLDAADSTAGALLALVHADSTAFALALKNANDDIVKWKYAASHRGVSRCGLGVGAGAAVNLHTATPGLTFGFDCRL